MRDLELVFAVGESEGGYMARALGCSVFTQAETIENLRVMIREAIYCHFEEDIPFKMVYPRSSV
jgi:predicted RNase H-like HicB family nuclease